MAEDVRQIPRETKQLSRGEMIAAIAGVVLGVIGLAELLYGLLWVLALGHASNWTFPGLVPVMNFFWELLEQVPFPDALGPVTKS